VIGNAMKYRSNRAPEIRITSEADDGCWKFSVQDNGVGISRAGQQSIFEMFHRLDPKTGPEGSGLGLSICKEIVERHGGRIWVESQPGAGSTFYFTLPMAGTPRKEASSERNSSSGAVSARA
jgi:signal transduction histidine kinase